MKTLESFIETLACSFTIEQREDGTTYTIIKSDSDLYEQLKEIVFDCHDGLLPHDVIYYTVSTILLDMSESIDSEVSLSDYGYALQGTELKDSEWYSFPYFSYYADKAIEELGGEGLTMQTICSYSQDIFFSEVTSIIKDNITSYQLELWDSEN